MERGKRNGDSAYRYEMSRTPLTSSKRSTEALNVIALLDEM